MGTTMIQLGGKQRPILCGFGALLAYERRTGRNVLEDYQQMAIGTASVTMIIEMVMACLINGAMSQDMQPDFDEYSVANWLGEKGKLKEVMQIIKESFEEMKAQEDDDAKKKTPKTVKAK